MTIFIWNVRGFNDPLKQKGMVVRIKSIKVQVVGLLETRVKVNNSKSITNRHFR